jgi:hypothetical protein
MSGVHSYHKQQPNVPLLDDKGDNDLDEMEMSKNNDSLNDYEEERVSEEKTERTGSVI